MENASKALIIAASILITVAIIALGVSIFIRAQNVATDAERELDSVLVNTHNAQFLEYENKTISYLQARELVATVLNNDTKINESIYLVGITVNLKSGSVLPFVIMEYVNGMKTITFNEEINAGQIPYGTNYKVTIKKSKQGLVDNIILTEI